MKMFYLEHRPNDRTSWEPFTEKLTGRVIFFGSWEAARNFALDSTDSRLRNQFTIVAPKGDPCRSRS